ncbi:alpha/beta hydrolase [Actinomyces capricornis]|uniref:Alpha/beta hydrolase n=1 Tax=Actinomyces capricornis TaxID=2755559 RepID=A0ABN6K852_9ACTO|nr:alpha/beta hydrolase [Actinomyces capricornis]BDA64533.1 alpha/beta hydrolase [Actinomyces capricornis]
MTQPMMSAAVPRGGKRAARDARQLRRATAMVAVAGAAILGVGPTTALAAPPAAPAPQAPVPPGLERFYSQSVEWYPCAAEGGMSASDAGTGFECATVEVPLDYENPGGQTIEIAMKKHGATGAPSKGALFLNPGGPGGSGVSTVEGLATPGRYVSADVAAAYDVIGFDPRGVGSSTPVRCEAPGQEGAVGQRAQVSMEAQEGPVAAPAPLLEGPVADPLVDPAVAEQSDPIGGLSFTTLVLLLQFSTAKTEASCAQHTQPAELLDHVDTVSVARDLDVLRALAGQEDLNYVGYSYGTYIGTLYADLFPENTGRIVLDAAIDPSQGQAEKDRDQRLAMEASRRVYLESCLATEGCPLSGDVDAASGQLDAFIEGLAANPVPTADPNAPLTGRQVENAIIGALYSSEAWPVLTEGLKQAMTQNDGSILARLGGAGEQAVVDNAGTAVNCQDYPVQGDMATWEANFRRDKADAPHYGGQLSDARCQAWGHNGTRAPAPVHAAGAAPILVVGTTGDPITPYSAAVSLADQLDSGQLLTWEGNGHAAYTRAGDCLNKAVDGYLLNGQMPQAGLVCTGQE